LVMVAQCLCSGFLQSTFLVQASSEIWSRAGTVPARAGVLVA
jgi:hypothetical protein